MNRVVLSGRLAGPPKLAYTAVGTPVAELRLLVPRTGDRGRHDEVLEAIDCVAFRDAAVELAGWGERGHRLNLEGRLRHDRYRNLEGAMVRGLRVFADHCYFLDPIKEPDAVRLPVPLEVESLPAPIEEAA